jgi:hypothetical protein
MYFVVRSPKLRLYRVKDANLENVPSDWHIYSNRNVATFYNKKTKEINIKFSGLKSLAEKSDFERENDRYENEFEFLFGKLTRQI